MAVEQARPSPEQFLTLIRRQERGRLKVYLGSAAGVGKTFAMLREGHRLKQQGLDVAIGFVETHGRAETAEQIGNLEVIPPKLIEYRGVTLREMDLDAILARRPAVCLVDELAHTNAPGSHHP
ncbi:MAG: histidine kinase, partial [Planctomycetaceae bacterium]|nr:histidine kinase [Planctomycetaceae bacterium]